MDGEGSASFTHDGSQVLRDLLKDFGVMKAGEVHKLTRKNPDVRPFESGGEQPLERHARKVDAGVFAHGSTSKKRPHNLILGRFFDGHVYDMVEVGVGNYKGMAEFGKSASMAGFGSKPCFVFQGPHFETEAGMKLLKSTLLDCFRGREVSTVNLRGIDRAIVCTASAPDQVHLRQYSIRLKKSGSWLPWARLKEMGPRLDMRLRRFREAPPDMQKEAFKRPAKPKQPKNVVHDPARGKVGRVYVPKQNLSSLKQRKRKKGNKGIDSPDHDSLAPPAKAARS